MPMRHNSRLISSRQLWPLQRQKVSLYPLISQANGWAWCSRTTTAAVPAGGTLAAAKSELVAGTIEYKRTVYAADVISFITPNTTCDIEVAFFANSYP